MKCENCGRIDLLDILQVAKELISYAVITSSYKRIETTDGGRTVR